MSRSRFARLLAALILTAISAAACAPPAGMIATLTMLPGTFTPPPTRSPSKTPKPQITETQQVFFTPTGFITLNATQSPILEVTNTIQPEPSPTLSYTPTYDATAAACPPFSMDTSLPVPDIPTGYIGRHYETASLPTGLIWIASGLLSNPDYSYTQILWQNREMFWIQKLVCKNQLDQPFWVINDSLALPNLNPQANQVYTNMCFLNGSQIPFALAYGDYDPIQPAVTISNFTGSKMQVSAAWQMKEKFTPLNLRGVTCLVQKP